MWDMSMGFWHQLCSRWTPIFSHMPGGCSFHSLTCLMQDFLFVFTYFCFFWKFTSLVPVWVGFLLSKAWLCFLSGCCPFLWREPSMGSSASVIDVAEVRREEGAFPCNSALHDLPDFFPLICWSFLSSPGIYHAGLHFVFHSSVFMYTWDYQEVKR